MSWRGTKRDDEMRLSTWLSAGNSNGLPVAVDFQPRFSGARPQPTAYCITWITLSDLTLLRTAAPFVVSAKPTVSLRTVRFAQPSVLRPCNISSDGVGRSHKITGLTFFCSVLEGIHTFMASVSPILYQDASGTVFLVDIPGSISAAQGSKPALTLRLVSTKPAEQPFVIYNTPHAAKSASIKHNTVDVQLHKEYESAIVSALGKIAKGRPNLHWCLPRVLLPTNPVAEDVLDLRSLLQSGPDKSSSRNETAARLNDLFEASMKEVPPDLHYRSGVSAVVTFRTSHILVNASAATAEEAGLDDDEGVWQPWHSSYESNSDSIQALDVRRKQNKGPSTTRRFLIPPRAAFLLADCADSTAFRAWLRSIDVVNDQSRRFDLILLDPPWPNASAKRKRAYKRPLTLRDVAELIGSMDLSSHIRPSGFLGVWITNSLAVRALVLDPGGIFDVINVGLVEEWIYTKTTLSGEPISDLGSTWRKPYEVLLIGRCPPSSFMVAEHSESIKRRVIAAVPDLHSRKPCLKVLVESLLLPPGPYRALEIFARNLVAGWASWGNEVLKFNWDGVLVSS